MFERFKEEERKAIRDKEIEMERKRMKKVEDAFNTKKAEMEQ